MKNGFKITTVVLGLFISQLGFASTKNILETTIMSATSFRLDIMQAKGTIQLRLLDTDGVVLHNESFQGTQGYHKVFNVVSLPSGQYQLEVEYPTTIQLLPIEITSSGIVIDNADAVELFKPFVRQRESTVSISVLNTKQEPLLVRVYDSGNQLVYKDKVDGEMSLGRQYNFSEMDPGSYMIRLTSNKRTYYHEVSVE